MRKVRYILSVLVAVAGLVSAPVIARAQTSNTISGGRSADYQPNTDNPQGNVGSGVQNTGTGLQPTPGRTSLSQEKLTGTTNLQVAGVHAQPNPNTTSIAPFKDGSTFVWWPFVVIGILTVGAAVYVVRQPIDKPKKATVNTSDLDDTKPEPLPVVKPQKPAKKKTAKKRKK
jgi:hypothetical protein